MKQFKSRPKYLKKLEIPLQSAAANYYLFFLSIIKRKFSTATVGRSAEENPHMGHVV